MTINNMFRIGGLNVVCLVGMFGLLSCNKPTENERWLNCFHDAKNTADKFVLQQEKGKGLYKPMGMFNQENRLLHIYYINEKNPTDRFVVELDLKTCAARFGGKVHSDVPELLIIANTSLTEKGVQLDIYDLPEVIEHVNTWNIVYREVHPRLDGGFVVEIDKQTRKTRLIGHFGEVQEP